MFGTSGHEAGYACGAILAALMQCLVLKQILSAQDAEDVLQNGVGLLSPEKQTRSVQLAIDLIEKVIGPKVRAIN